MFEKMGRMTGRSYEDTVQALIKSLKYAEVCLQNFDINLDLNLFIDLLINNENFDFCSRDISFSLQSINMFSQKYLFLNLLKK